MYTDLKNLKDIMIYLKLKISSKIKKICNTTAKTEHQSLNLKLVLNF